MAKQFGLWLSELRATVPGADDAVMLQQVGATVREMFVKGGGWVQDFDPITLREGEASYLLNPQTQGYAVYVTKAEVDGKNVQVYTDEPSVSSIVGVYLSGENVVLSPAATELQNGKILQLRGTWKIEHSATGVPDRFYELYFDVVLDGAKSKLYMQPSKPWTDPLAAGYHGKRYNSGVSRFRLDMRRGHTGTDPTWKYPSWA